MRRMLVETAPPLDAVIYQYPAHHIAYGRSSRAISDHQDTSKPFYRFLIDRGI